MRLGSVLSEALRNIGSGVSTSHIARRSSHTSVRSPRREARNLTAGKFNLGYEDIVFRKNL